MLKEVTGDLIEDKNIAVIIREGYSDGFPGKELTKKIYEKYPKVQESDESTYKEYQSYGPGGSMKGSIQDDGRIVITWYVGEKTGELTFDDVVEAGNLFNEYIFYKGLPGSVGIPEGMCGEQWKTVRKIIIEISDIHPVYDFCIVKPKDA